METQDSHKWYNMINETGGSPFLFEYATMPQKRGLMKTIRRGIILVLMTILIVIIGLEALLTVIDPLGVHAYFRGIALHQAQMIPDPSGYALRDGVHDFGYQVTIHDGLRALPRRDNPSCTLAWLGDSVTFGVRVDDDETFAYHIAQAYPDVQFINTARSGYNIGNIERVVNTTDADGYIYLVIRNDATPDAVYSPPTDGRWQSTMSQYIYAYTHPAATPDIERFVSIANPLLSRDDVLTFAFDTPDFASRYALEHRAIRLPAYTDFVSAYDSHPNARGHETIANGMMPYLPEFIDRVCNG